MNCVGICSVDAARRRAFLFPLGWALVWLGLLPPALVAAPASTAIAHDALRLLQAECFPCHNEEKKKGGLILSTHSGLLKGNDDGPVVAVSQPESSRLIRALAAGADPHMPPKKQLPADAIRLLRDWIQLGAPWNAQTLTEEEPIVPVALTPLPPAYQPAMGLALSPDGKRLAASRGGTITVYDLAQTNSPAIAHWTAHTDAVRALTWSQDGRWLISGGFRRLAIWQGTTLHGELTTGLRGLVSAVKSAPQGKLLAIADSTAGQAGYVRLVSVPEGKIIASWLAHADTTFDLDFSRDGRQLATAGGDHLVKIWEIDSRKELARLEGHANQVLAVAFNTNATQVVSGGADRTLRVWDIATRERISALGEHKSPINGVAWPGDGATIFAATEAGLVLSYRNLKAHTGEQSSASGDEKRIGDLPDTLLALATSPDAQILFASGQDGLVQGWQHDGKKLPPFLPPPLDTNHATLVASGGLQHSPAARVEVAHPLRATAAPTEATAGAARAPEARIRNQPPAETKVSQHSVGLNGQSFWSRVQSLSAEPKELRLDGQAARAPFLITARLDDGFEADVTEEARFSLSRPAPFELAGPGEVRARETGRGILTAHFGGKRVAIPVTVASTSLGEAPAGGPPTVSFVRDVLPALSRAGCNAGPCHAKPEGQNGFRLSVFSYDPKSDYQEIVRKAKGRRVFPAAPEESLILQKPLTLMPHEGGLRFERGSETHQLLVRWLREGMAYTLTNEPVLQGITVFPQARRYRHNSQQRLLVRAQYSDGSVRDVTRLAAFVENDKEIAKVDESGVVRIGQLTGQGVVVARYMGFVADAHILVPAARLLPEELYAALPRQNFIDDLAYAQFQRLGLFPSELCTDAEFLRRATLDAIGRLPTPEEVRAFLDDRSPDKRRKCIARVLDDPAYADCWANKWADLLRPNPDRVGVKSVFTLDQWLRESFRQNKPYDQFVREILLAEGSNHRDGPAVIYRDRREPPELTTMFSQLFLGTRLECAKCHHHPNEKWSQDDFYQFAAFFGPLKQKGAGLSPPISAGTEEFYFAPGGSVKHPVSGIAMTPRPLDGTPVAGDGATDPRGALADWLTAPENPFFARAAVNRVWAVFFGRGLVEPVDDFRVSNPCVNPVLLTALAEDFARHRYDLKHLIRTILESRLYQLSATPNESNLADTRNFSRAYRRRLPAEVLLDAVDEATGVPETFAGMPEGALATQTWSYKIQSHFLDAFGRPNSSSDCPCERDARMSVVQSLHLMNAKELQAKLVNPAGHARRWADSARTPSEIIREIYLATVSRPPAPDELAIAATAFNAKDATRRSATEDVFWALLNSAEFVFNH